MRQAIVFLALTSSVAACADLTPTQQRALTGTAIGAGGGAVLGAIGGNAALGRSRVPVLVWRPASWSTG
jgi:hypothetical protein